MSKIPFLFKYSGNKKTIVPLLRKPQPYKRIVEAYLGSGAFICANEGPSLGIDKNPNIIDLWKWLRDEATSERLRELTEIVREAVDKAPDKKPDVRLMGLSKAETLYVRINVTGAYCGQLSSWKVYPQYKLPVEKTASLLKRIQDVKLICGTENDYVEQDGDIVFLDPPYLATRANYKEDGKSGIEEGYRPEDTIRLIKRTAAPIIFTYGTNAQELFPDFSWEIVKKKKVPNLRRGGTVERIEHVTYLNWS